MGTKSKKEPTRKEKRVNRIVLEAKSNHKGHEIKYVQAKMKQYESLFSMTAYVAPIFLTIAGLAIPNCFDWTTKVDVLIQIGLMLLAIITGVCFASRKSSYSLALSQLKKDTQIKNNKINELRQIIARQNGDIDFLIGLLNNLGKHIAKGDSTMAVLANVLAVEIYHDCQRLFGDDFEVTINIYEKIADQITMIGHQQVKPYSDAPALYLSGVNGLKATDERIKDFFCVKCINGRKDINCIADWKTLVDAFNWHSVNKNEIKKSKQACRDAGFTYNQYISYRSTVDGDNNHSLMLEIIAHNESVIDTAENLEKTARKLFSIYMPLVVMLTTVASHEE